MRCSGTKINVSHAFLFMVGGSRNTSKWTPKASKHPHVSLVCQPLLHYNNAIAILTIPFYLQQKQGNKVGMTA